VSTGFIAAAIASATPGLVAVDVSGLAVYGGCEVISVLSPPSAGAGALPPASAVLGARGNGRGPVGCVGRGVGLRESTTGCDATGVLGIGLRGLVTETLSSLAGTAIEARGGGPGARNGGPGARGGGPGARGAAPGERAAGPGARGGGAIGRGPRRFAGEVNESSSLAAAAMRVGSYAPRIAATAMCAGTDGSEGSISSPAPASLPAPAALATRRASPMPTS
jgi:hypothetical protein